MIDFLCLADEKSKAAAEEAMIASQPDKRLTAANFNVKHCRIDTRVPGRSADHSFSGVLFDVTSK
jgi:hypothetical protein